MLRNLNAMKNKTEIGECSTKYTGDIEPLLERQEDRISHPVNGDTYQASGFLQHINVNSIQEDFDDDSEEDVDIIDSEIEGATHSVQLE